MVKKVFRRKIFATLLFSFVGAIVLIVHGVFFDLDLTQIKRLTLAGFITTFVLSFVGLLILEKIFTLEEDYEIVKLKERVSKLERRR